MSRTRFGALIAAAMIVVSACGGSSPTASPAASSAAPSAPAASASAAPSAAASASAATSAAPSASSAGTPVNGGNLVYALQGDAV